MGDIYACCYLCYAMVDCKSELISRIKSMARGMLRGSLDTRLSRWTKYFYKEAHQAIVNTFLQCSWWKRVWTWQEAVLPLEVLSIAETLTELSDSDLLSINDLHELIFEGMFAELAIYDTLSDEDGRLFKVTVRKLFQTPISTTPIDGIKQMTFTGSISQEISWSRDHCHSHYNAFSTTLFSFKMLLMSFAQSPRQCMDPVDYVYGVLGIFQIDISRKTDPNEVWQLFVTELLKLLSDTERVKIKDDHDRKVVSMYNSDRRSIRQCYPLTVKNMGEVYSCFDIHVLDDVFCKLRNLS